MQVFASFLSFLFPHLAQLEPSQFRLVQCVLHLLVAFGGIGYVVGLGSAA